MSAKFRPTFSSLGTWKARLSRTLQSGGVWRVPDNAGGSVGFYFQAKAGKSLAIPHSVCPVSVTKEGL